VGRIERERLACDAGGSGDSQLMTDALSHARRCSRALVSGLACYSLRIFPSLAILSNQRRAFVASGRLLWFFRNSRRAWAESS
jgi:hypothetical protein